MPIGVYPSGILWCMSESSEWLSRVANCLVLAVISCSIIITCPAYHVNSVLDAVSDIRLKSSERIVADHLL